MTTFLQPGSDPAFPLAALCLGALDPGPTWKRALYLGIALVLLAGAGLGTRFGRRVWNALERRWTGPAAVSTERIEDDGSYRNLIFLHHSTGENLIRHGDVRAQLSRRGYQFWDHDYNQDGITRPDGKRTHSHYEIPEKEPGTVGGGNTDPEGLAVLFAQPPHDPPDNAFSRLLQHPVVIFKSCFPNSALKSDAMLESHKALYLGMRRAMEQHPRHLFILLTTPPLNSNVTSAAEAKRARLLSQWLQSEAFVGGHPNLRVFDFFDLLADPATNMLRVEYQTKDKPRDSHPNVKANEVIGPLFVEFVDQTVRSFRSRVALAEPAPEN